MHVSGRHDHDTTLMFRSSNLNVIRIAIQCQTCGKLHKLEFDPAVTSGTRAVFESTPERLKNRPGSRMIVRVLTLQ